MNTSTQSKGAVFRGKYFVAALVAAVIGVSSAFAGQADDQVAVQLGALQQGINLAAATDAQVAQALVVGRAQLKLVGLKNSSVATDLFRTQLYQATERALTSPLTRILTKVLPSGGGIKVISAKFDPKKTTPAKITSYALKRTPNYGPGLANIGVAATFAMNGGTPVWGYTVTDPILLALKQQKDAAKLSGAALVAALKSYVKGTKNWLPTQVGVNVNQLPLWDPKKGGNATTATKLASAASAVTSNAIDGLGVLKTAANVQALTVELVKAAARYQSTSLNYVKIPALSATNSGSVGGAMLGIVTQVAGPGNFNWSGAVNPILTGIVNGAVKASKKNITAIAIGLVAGFTATYLATTDIAQRTTDNMSTAAEFITQNSAAILSAFTAAAKITKLEVIAALQTAINNAVTDTYSNVNSLGNLAGAAGINLGTLNPFLNGVGNPVTDTVGL